MKKSLIVISFLMLFMVAHATVKETVVDYLDAEMSSLGKGGTGCLWDFSNNALTDRHKITYLSDGDSLFYVITRKDMNKYILDGNHLLWAGYENRQSNMNGSIIPSVMSFPFSFGEKAEAEYLLTGKYSNSFYQVEVGTVVSIADAHGNMILPGGDTITNLMRVKETKLFHTAMSTESIKLPLDTISDTIPLQETITYRWFTTSSLIPVAIYTESKIYEKGKIVQKEVSGLLMDSNDVVLSRKNHTETATGKNYFQQGQANRNINNVNIGNLEIKTHGKEIVANYKLNSHKEEYSRTTVSIIDLQGRIYSQETDKVKTGQPHNVRFDISSLQPGDYMVVVSIDGNESTAEKRLLKIR